jgi:DnaJ-domain-containing protein 1
MSVPLSLWPTTRGTFDIFRVLRFRLTLAPAACRQASPGGAGSCTLFNQEEEGKFVYGIVTDAAIQILFVVAGTLALSWYLAEGDRAKARRRQVIAKTLERLHTATQPLNLETINDGGAAARFMRQKFAAEDQRKLAGMVQMAERVAQAGMQWRSQVADGGESNAMTHYEVLNVSEKASAAVIKRTYHLLMKAFHPDYLANPSDDLTTQHAVDIVKAINAAYFVLSNPSRRASYDVQLASERAAIYVPQAQASYRGAAAGAHGIWSHDAVPETQPQPSRRQNVNRMFD